MADEILDEAPFPPLRWDGEVFTWCGEVRLPSWAGFQDRSGPYASIGARRPSDGIASLFVIAPDDESEDERTPPSSEQAAAFRYLMANETAVAAAVGRAIVEYYPEARRRHLENLYSDKSTPLPDVADPGGLRPLLGLSCVHVLTVAHDGSAYIGFEFGCAWDDEHGLGVMTHRGRVINTGQADFAFTEWVAEEDPERPTEPA